MKDPNLRTTTPASAGNEPARGAGPKRRGWRRFLLRTRSKAAPDPNDPDAFSAARAVEQRRERRTSTHLLASTASIDPLRDPATGTPYYAFNDDNRVLDLSRRGVGLRCTRPPTVGTRLMLQIHMQDEATPIELIGRACWTRVVIEPGETGPRAAAAVGIELLGGSRATLERYDRSLVRLQAAVRPLVATSEALR